MYIYAWYRVNTRGVRIHEARMALASSQRHSHCLDSSPPALEFSRCAYQDVPSFSFLLVCSDYFRRGFRVSHELFTVSFELVGLCAKYVQGLR